MYLPKSDIHNCLKQQTPYYVSQTQPPTFNKLPAIIFRVGNNDANTDLDNEILYQNIEIIIDIWAEDSVSASGALEKVEEVMRENLNYRLSFSTDVPNTGNLFHIQSRFTTIF